MSDEKKETSFWNKLSTMVAQHQLEASDMVLAEYAKQGVRAERFGFIELTESKDETTRGIGRACVTNSQIRDITIKAKKGRSGGPIDQDHFCVVILEGEEWYYLNGLIISHKDRPFEPEGWTLIDNAAHPKE